MFFKKLIIITVAILICMSCANDSTSDLIDGMVVENPTYTANVKSIIDNNCISCHSNPPQNGAPMSLTTYENVKMAVESRGLIERISLPESDPDHMPLGGPRLPQNLIDIIIQWEAEGFQQ